MQLAKKLLLSASVIGLFIVYSLWQRGGVQLPASTPTTSTPTQPATNNTSSNQQPTTPSAYKNGTYVGDSADAFYGTIQVEAIISGGKLSDVQFLQYPNDRENSIEINSQAMPALKQEAIQAQSAKVNTITGATDTSQAFIASLTSALTQAH